MGVKLEYPLTRPFPGKWFALLSLCGALVVVVFLTVINVALVGYDTIAVFKDDYNARDTHWFDDFLSSRVRKRKCDAAFFSLGDTIRTNASLFEWRVESIKNGNAATGLSYKGETLAGCDLSSIFMNAVLSTWTLDVTALVKCKIVDQVEASMKTTFAISALPGRYDSSIEEVSTLNSSNSTPSARLLAIGAVAEAGTDIAAAVMGTFVQNSSTAPVVISTRMNLPFCPANSDPNSPCLQEVPKFSIEMPTLVYADNRLVQEVGSEHATDGLRVMSDYLPIWTNFAQALYAAVRIDLGNNHPNNFLLNPSAVGNTLAPSFAPLDISGPLSLSRYLENQTIAGVEFTGALPISSNFGPSHIQTTYLCRFEQIKEPGSLIMAVLVATLSTFASAWALYLTVAAKILKRRGEQWSRCEVHEDYSMVPTRSRSPMLAPKSEYERASVV